MKLIKHCNDSMSCTDFVLFVQLCYYWSKVILYCLQGGLLFLFFHLLFLCVCLFSLCACLCLTLISLLFLSLWPWCDLQGWLGSEANYLITYMSVSLCASLSFSQSCLNMPLVANTNFVETAVYRSCLLEKRYLEKKGSHLLSWHAHAHTPTHAHIHTYTCTRTYTCKHMCIHAHTHHTHVCIWTCACIHVCMTVRERDWLISNTPDKDFRQ